MSVNLDCISTGSLFQRVAALYWKVRLPALMFHIFFRHLDGTSLFLHHLSPSLPSGL